MGNYGRPETHDKAAKNHTYRVSKTPDRELPENGTQCF